MKKNLATITARGRVTIPVEVLSALGVSPGDKVAFVIDDSGKVEIRRGPYSMAELEGIVPALKRPHRDDFGDVIAEAREEQVARIMAEERSSLISRRQESPSS